MKKITLLVVIITITLGLFAQPPQAFKYQAVVRDIDGSILNNQLVSFQISILQGSSTGLSVYTETHQIITNDIGVANLEIGSGSTTDDFTSIDWSTGLYFLKVDMDASGNSNYQWIGTSQLLSVPYALYSEQTANPGDIDWTIAGEDMYSGVPGNIGIGTTTPTAKLDVAGHISVVNTGGSVFIGENAGINDDFDDNYNVFIGENAGKTNSGGSHNVAVGRSSLYTNTYGYGNTAIGERSMEYNALGSTNAAVGYYSLNELSEGNGNSAFGAYAQRNNTLGQYNTSVGNQSIYHNESGDSNTAVGYMAGFGNYGSPFSGCVFLGYQAGWNNTSNNKLFIENSSSDSPLIYGEFDNDILAVNGRLGVGKMTPNATLDVAGHISISNTGHSVFLGYDAGKNDDFSGNSNVFVGNSAGYNNTSGDKNIAIGRNAMFNTSTGHDNTAIGYIALQSNTTGSGNTGIGSVALENNTTGYSNTAIGTDALYNNTDRSNLVAVGDSALYNNGLNASLYYHATHNSAVGSKALFSNKTGYANTAVGFESIYSNVYGSANTAIGTSTLRDATGDLNSALGSEALKYNSTAEWNTAVGAQSLLWNTTGNKNTAVGGGALYFNETGGYNTTIGWGAGQGSSGNSVSGCVFIGYEAGSNVSSNNKLYIENSDSDSPLIYGEFDNDIVAFNGRLGIGTMTPDATLEVAGHISVTNTGYSVFIGEHAGYNDDLSDKSNVFIGTSSGFNNTSGYVNTAVGAGALYDNSTGYSNTALGFNSLANNTTGHSNTAIGNAAMYETNLGLENVALGHMSLSNNTTGDNNIAIGNLALYHTLTGNNNTAVGYQAGFGSSGSSRSGCVYLGYQAGYNNGNDNRLYIDNSSTSTPLIWGNFASDILTVNGNLGIGTNSPLVKLNVVGGTDASLTGGGYIVTGSTTGQNIVMDENEIMARNNGAINSLHMQRDGGDFALHYGLDELFEFRVKNDGKTGIGVSSPSAKLHINTSAEEDGVRVLINGTTKFRIPSNGGVVVGFNYSTPTYALQLANNSSTMAGWGAAYAWYEYSDNRIKSNQKKLTYGLKEVMQLNPKSYDHHSSSTNEEGEFVMVTNQKVSTIGFIAQEVQNIIPEAVNEPENKSTDLWTMDYNKLIPVLTKAIQEQQDIIEEMQKRIDVLENQQP